MKKLILTAALLMGVSVFAPHAHCFCESQDCTDKRTTLGTNMAAMAAEFPFLDAGTKDYTHWRVNAGSSARRIPAAEILTHMNSMRKPRRAAGDHELNYIRDNCTVADRNHLSAQINKSLSAPLQTFFQREESDSSAR